MIPFEGNLFEASGIHVPVATKQHTLECKKEIDQILEIIDVIDLYQSSNKTVDTPKQTEPENND